MDEKRREASRIDPRGSLDDLRTHVDFRNPLIVPPGGSSSLISEMGEGGVLFGDGMETDTMDFDEGRSVELSIAKERLRLVVPRAIFSLS